MRLELYGSPWSKSLENDYLTYVGRLSLEEMLTTPDQSTISKSPLALYHEWRSLIQVVMLLARRKWWSLRGVFEVSMKRTWIKL